jgi:hypothetical protein
MELEPFRRLAEDTPFGPECHGVSRVGLIKKMSRLGLR